jgi:NO-binding membrane sensor protein with MHYT domain
MRPQPGFLVLSIIVSILGSYATLLLLGRRTSNRGLRNFGFLAVSAICFAAVAVWGMHFVSMISVRLDPSPNLSWAIMVSRPILQS